MVNDFSTHGTPRKLLLATDLSARCDRALERAVSLAKAWQAQLTVLHVLEDALDPLASRSERSLPSWRRPPDALAIARQRIHQGLRADVGDALDRAIIMIEEGEPPDVIERVASSDGSDLIVTGIASERPFAHQPVILGKTVERLLRRSATPVLIVRNRARVPYEHILVATDFSDTSARALQAALRFFPSQPLQLLHAYDLPYANLMPDTANFEQGFGEAISVDLDVFLTSLDLSPEDRRRLNPLIERGRPHTLIRAYASDHNADLVVLGTNGRNAVLEALLGNTAKHILAALPCDALVVRAAQQRTQQD
jgi:nucleotide-binding universal stress UspA family protein